MDLAPRQIYHITHVNNLPAILAAQMLIAKNKQSRASQPVNISYPSIQDQRATTLVPCGPGGYLHDYVPFYFCNRSPMLKAIHDGMIPNCTNQSDIVYLVTTTQIIQSRGLPFVFTNGHGIMRLTSFYTDLADLNRIDWTVIRSWSWSNTHADGDRKRRKQAEFLVFHSIPWNVISHIAVASDVMQSRIKALLHKSNAVDNPVVTIRSSWYY